MATETFVSERLLKAERAKRIHAQLIQPIIGGLIGSVFLYFIMGMMEVVRYVD